jgi:hypothetical protein
MLIAGAGFWAWQRFLSRDAQIAAMHEACLSEFADAAARAKAGLAPGTDASSIARSLGGGLARLIEGASGNVGGAVCDAARDACRADFEGVICTAARDRFR